MFLPTSVHDSAFHLVSDAPHREHRFYFLCLAVCVPLAEDRGVVPMSAASLQKKSKIASKFHLSSHRAFLASKKETGLGNLLFLYDVSA